MDPIFEHPVFDSPREKMKRFIRQLEKSQEALENSLYTCFKCRTKNIFPVAKQVRSVDEGTSVFNECRGMDDTHYATNLQSKFSW